MKEEIRSQSGNGLALMCAVIFVFWEMIGEAQTFTNVAAAQQINAITAADSYGNGMSFYDFNNDGWDDLTFAMYSDNLAFFINNEGVFTQLPPMIYGQGLNKHLLWVDYDNDGDLDLFKTTYQGPYQLWRNNGNFNFTNVSVAAGLAQTNRYHTGASFADYDRDGDLDLYICTYEVEGDESMFDRLNHLYRNNGDGTFTDVTLEAGVGNGIKYSFQAVWFDYDHDDWPDLYVINDRQHANTFYRNNGNGTFTDVTIPTGTALTEHDPMSCSVGDFDNDGDLDIFMTNTGNPNKPCKLLVNNNNGTFSEMGDDYNLDFYSWTWGALWVDYNNNTFQDLYITSAHPSLPAESNFFLGNLNGENFLDAEVIFQSNHIAKSFSPARGDFNNDGYYDIAVQNQFPYAPFLWENSGGANNYIKITLQGTKSNLFAIGSLIKVYAGGNAYTQYTFCGENYLGQNSQHHIFGLAQYSVVDSVKIRYISGHTDTYYNLAVNEHYFFTEGETYHAEIIAPDDLSGCAGDTIVLDAGDHFSYTWNTGEQERYLKVYEGGDYWFTASNSAGVETHSDTVSVSYHPTPELILESSSPLCFGDTTGWILLENFSGVETEFVNWSSGHQGEFLENLAPGIYSFLYQDFNGCRDSGIVIMDQPVAMVVSYSTTPVLEGEDGTISITVNGGVPPYQYNLNGEEIPSFVDGLGEGIYLLHVEDQNGCEATLEVVVSGTSSVPRIINSFILTPNPTKGKVRLEGSLLPDVITVYDPLGKMVLHLDNPVTNEIDLNFLPPGIYLVQMKVQDKVIQARIVKD